MSAILVLVALVTVILSLLYVLAQRKFSYWEKKNVPFLKPQPFLGNYGPYILLREYVGHLMQKLCQQFPGKPYFGAFYGTEPVLVIQSPEILKEICTKDFYYFNGREVSPYGAKEIVTRNLFFSSGDQWKIIRQNLTPLFTSGKMKNMFHLIDKCCHVLEDVLDRDTSTSTVIEMRDLSTRYTMDCICSCSFGVESNTMKDPENNPFRFMGTEIFRPSTYRGFKLLFRATQPYIFYGLGFKLFPDSIHTFFSQLLKGVFNSRNHQPSSRNDFVDLVLTLKKEDIISCESASNVKTGLDTKVFLKVDDELLVSQCIMFFAAGFDTSATTLSFTLFELAKNPEVQKRAFKEVDDYLRRHGNKLDYDCITELPYLEACLYESLRMYPVFGNLTREVMDDATLSDGLSLDKGIRIHIPVYKLHYDPEYFPEPNSYKPERFLPENKRYVTPYTFFPYGEGPRACLGQRFSKMQILPGLVTVLKKYQLELAEGMPREVQLESRTILIQPKEQGLMLKITKREGWEKKKLVRT